MLVVRAGCKDVSKDLLEDFWGKRELVPRHCRRTWGNSWRAAVSFLNMRFYYATGEIVKDISVCPCAGMGYTSELHLNERWKRQDGLDSYAPLSISVKAR